LPYKNELDLPASVQKNLPNMPKKIYLEAFNKTHGMSTKIQKIASEMLLGRRRPIKVAWSAVKKSYEENGKNLVCGKEKT